MSRVPAKRTPWTSQRAFAVDVVRGAMAAGLQLEAAQLVAAHAAHSCGWGRSAWNYNLTGMKAGPHALCPPMADYPRDDYPDQPTGYVVPDGTTAYGDYVCLLGSEVVGGEVQRERMAWLAFDGVESWSRRMLSWLRGNPRYRQSVAYLDAGDPRYFLQLRRDGWFTGSGSEFDASARARLAVIRSYTSHGEAALGGRLTVALALGGLAGLLAYAASLG